MKKILAVFICVLLTLGMVTVLAAENADFIVNGSFEDYTDNLPDGWTVPVGTPGEDIIISGEAKDGKASVRLYGKSENAFLQQEAEGLRNGAKYTLSFYILRQSGEVITSRIEFAYTENGGRKYLSENAVITPLGETETGKWVKKEITFTVPPKAEKTVLAFRKVGAADVYFDGVSVSGGEESGEIAIEEESGTWSPKAIENPENLITNGDLEKVTNGFPTGWTPFSEELVSLNTNKEYVHSGQNSIKIVASDSSLPWARFEITENIVPGAECTFSAWVYSPTAANNVGFKTEYYVTNYDHRVNTGNGKSERVNPSAADGWIHVSATERIPDDSDSVWVYFRLYGKGELYFDDVEFRITKGPEAFNTLLTDEVFYYSEWEGAGNATVTANTAFYPEFVGMPLHFTVQDREMVLFEETIPMNENGSTTFEFPLSVLEELHKEYIIRVKLHDHEGNLIAQKQETIFKVERPKFITEEGYYVENGKRFDPVYLYHIARTEEDLAKASEAGFNMIQGYPVQADLDLLAEHGMKAFIVLYTGGSSGQSAGHEKKIAGTIRNVTQFKDHPAVFGWALMDEPTPAAWEDLKRAFIEIRKIDPNHPVFITMNSNFETTGRFADAISADSYPYGFSPFTTTDFKNVDKVVDIARNRKPVYDLLQAFDYRNSYPTASEMRSMMYQNFWAGAEGIGIYSWKDSGRNEDGTAIPIYDTHLWEPITTFFELEYDEVIEHFVYKKYPTFNEVREDGYWYRSWVKDGKLSLVLLNRKDKENVEATVNLLSADGKVKVENFTARVINGASSGLIKGEDGIFKVNLEPGQTILYSIDVDKNLSGVVSSGFFDMYQHGWAEEAVKTLNEKDVLYTNGHKYYPGENVTRADFAYMLMRALEIPEAEAEMFADVKEWDYFKDELAAGRAAGLLNGMGDNVFGAEMPISRQDLMVMCMRAAEYAGKLAGAESADLSRFTDGAAVADYAVDAVGKMVESGIVVGNADGTVNPHGNATRAEAAVIIARLLAQK